ncbi:MAG: UPF0182 family protein [Coriobacteriaceae bacterium]|nr:UPF0182 family protein [Coriobacteriaceae bacterium]
MGARPPASGLRGGGRRHHAGPGSRLDRGDPRAPHAPRPVRLSPARAYAADAPVEPHRVGRGRLRRHDVTPLLLGGPAPGRGHVAAGQERRHRVRPCARTAVHHAHGCLSSAVRGAPRDRRDRRGARRRRGRRAAPEGARDRGRRRYNGGAVRRGPGGPGRLSGASDRSLSGLRGYERGRGGLPPVARFSPLRRVVFVERRSRANVPAAVVFVLVFLGLPLLTWLATFYTDFLWFEDLGQTGVFWTALFSRLAIWVGAGALAFAVLFVNMRVARRMAPRVVLTEVDGFEPAPMQVLRELRARFEPVIDRIVAGAGIVLAFAFGASLAAEWQTFRLAMAAGPFGLVDPQFGRDVGFYVFSLPVLRFVSDWVWSLLWAALLLSVLVHLIDGGIRPWERLAGFSPHVKAHISVLLGLIVASKGFDYWLRIWELNFSPRGQVVGASYTDVNAQLPALRILMVIAVAVGVALLLNIRFQGWRLPVAGLAVWIAASVLIGGVWPSLVQALRVAPNEVTAEMPYIERNIKATREAFGLESVKTRPFPAATDLTARDVVNNADTLSNVRLWDPSIVGQSYRQLQAIRAYYDFKDVDVDRYRIDGKRRQVLVSAREMDVNLLAPQARTWVNQHLVYTHGYGLVMSPVSEATGTGIPAFVLKDIPPTTTADVRIERPELYFGEGEGNYVLVNTGLDEFDYPVGDKNATVQYKGKAGVSVSSLLRRAAFALRFGSWQFLLSGYITPESRVLFSRRIVERVERLAPWLWLDGDPYPVVADGRIVWVLDGYTWSDRYPYSEVFRGVSYARNSVKVTVDAYDGTVTFYAWEPDPILTAWRGVFPGLIRDGDEMPAEVREHLRYPEDLFALQADVYKNYHMLDPQIFYNKEDSWELPGERAEGEAMAPYYVLMRLPGDTVEDFLMMIPFTPRNRDNMIGWMAARSDPAAYGERVVLQFPKQKTVLGPHQVSAQINQDPAISPQITLWSQAGSKVLFGNMLTIPLEDSVVFVQPMYLQAEKTAIPELTRVIVVYADKVVMEDSLPAALLKVFGVEEPEAATGGETTVAPGAGGSPKADAALAAKLYKQAIDAQKRGDWAEYGRLIGELGRVLERMAAASRAATATP